MASIRWWRQADLDDWVCAYLLMTPAAGFHRLATGTSMLVRPDGYVASVANADDGDVLGHYLDAFGANKRAK
jgi:hypothetical protein